MAAPGEVSHQGVLPFERQLDRYQRIDTLMHVEGFLPTCLPEQTEALSLQSFPPGRGGAAAHLAEVVKHQRTAQTDDPLAAARSITRRYIDWAHNACESGRALENLATELDGVNPELVLDRVLQPDDARMLPFLRFCDLATLSQQRRTDAVGYDPQKVNYVPTNPGIMFYVGEAVSQWRVYQVRRRLPDAVSHEAARFTFWGERLTEVARHFPALRPIAEDGFAIIYGRDRDTE